MKKLTISVTDEFYAGLHTTVGRRRIGMFLEKLARPYVMVKDLTAAYADMVQDENREKEAAEWVEAVIGDVDHETR